MTSIAKPAVNSRRREVETSVGVAWVDVDRVRGSSRMLVIGHGAGGSVDAPDLLAVRSALLAAGVSVARVTQPYRVLGRKAPPAAATLDAAWREVLSSLARSATVRGQQVYTGGRSSGARVACRCAVGSRPPVAGVVALAFPLHPPGKPESSRLGELEAPSAAGIPVLVVQGESDPFGRPEPAPGRSVVLLPGDHSLKRSATAVGQAVAQWLLATDD